MGRTRTRGRWFVLLFLLCSIPLFLGSDALPTWWVELAWDANTEKDVVGYRIYHRKLDLGYEYLGEVHKTDCVVTELEPMVDHYFAVTAYDEGGLESGFSKELKFRAYIVDGGADDGCFVNSLRR